MNERKPATTRFPVTGQPVIRLVDLFAERTQYTRKWILPFNSLSLFLEDDPSDPSWVELTEKNERFELKKDCISFTTYATPMILHYTPAHLHFCIHFNCEILPGIDLFFGIRERHMFMDPELRKEMLAIYTEPDPLRRLTMAESAALKITLRFWPEKMPLNMSRMADFEPLLRYIRKNLVSHPDIPEMAAVMGWSDAHFARTFREVFSITPKQYLNRELFAKAISLLKDPDKTVKEIAEELGFSSEFNFSRFIRQCSGISPSVLRKGNKDPFYIRK